MTDIDPFVITEAMRRDFAKAFAEAHQRGEVPDREFARARIEGAIAQWAMQAWEAAGKPDIVPDNIMDGRPEIERVSVNAVDDALPHLKPSRAEFLNTLAYLLRERDDALDVAKARAEKLDKAAALLREAAALLDDSHTAQFAKVARSLADWTGAARYGRPFLTGLKEDGIYGQFEPDSLSARLTGKRGGKSRDANIVKSIAGYFPDSDDFLTRANGYAIIAGLAKLCGLEGKTAKANSAAYVRSVLDSNRRAAKAEAPKPRRDNSIVGLLT
ncbi:hypothetical protein JKG47_05310 [Acidithiobacillus sp. MC6.1]|nr:hypothetical protein [Acidithiobacillus sp. MC6.1]